MNVDEAIAVIDDIASKLAAIGLPVWRDALFESTSTLRTHLNRKVDDAMVERACEAYESYRFLVPDSKSMHLALIAAMGGDDDQQDPPG